MAHCCVGKGKGPRGGEPAAWLLKQACWLSAGEEGVTRSAGAAIRRQCRWRGGIDQHMCTYMWLLVVHSWSNTASSAAEYCTASATQPAPLPAAAPHLKLNGGGATVLRQGRRMRVTCAWADRGCPGGSSWARPGGCVHTYVCLHTCLCKHHVHSALVRPRWLCAHIRVCLHTCLCEHADMGRAQCCSTTASSNARMQASTMAPAAALSSALSS